MFLSLEAEETPDVSQNYEIEAVPTFIILKNAEVSQKYEGTSKAQ
jgi:thioredoxin-like negative regulator of GroEL